ncbi:MAG: diguanylate cyclase [Sulfurimonas sp. RIFOXYD12_FULL_33_39]|uniref:GGDEF domain-containing protein n=1 Tax=unclassified Sulfurimonas TaxID=2623549 RepID=UPI0008BF1A41|nr:MULTISPECIES: GGDEF domain-containing protein [unclassified Sulfurimonas]OHE02802.1 MAG: diguanylate cyclase [Sulfurimonas sp. RIFCSPLOWO2_12_FULL_34_6]OHE09923.1 MAG: diguanylate cyclase [Sulfurimonas sp. RIFOXYD12_FULL_33_39]OHE13569.1 MAG: diguanylate cyclase [Sulfurimonas sp. RIFOXYD2_FULL_34_21]
MSGTLKSRIRRNVKDENALSDVAPEPEGDLEAYSKEVLSVLMKNGLPPTPNNFSLYFDRLLEDKSENTRKHIMSILELEESNEDENSILLEQSLKQGFSSVKNILGVTANLYKNMALMTKILDKRKQELEMSSSSTQDTRNVAASLESDISKLNSILKKQSSSMKEMYDDTAKIIKNVENETIFDNQYGVYNKRYLMTKIEQEIELIYKFKHKSSLIMIELSRNLKKSVNNDKAIMLMTKTIARLLLKTSRRSDTVAHYGNGVFTMLLKHTDIDSAKRASERLCDLVSNSNFFLADREIQLKISIGITDITENHSVEEIIVSSMDAIEKAYEDPNLDYAVLVRSH